MDNEKKETREYSCLIFTKGCYIHTTIDLHEKCFLLPLKGFSSVQEIEYIRRYCELKVSSSLTFNKDNLLKEAEKSAPVIGVNLKVDATSHNEAAEKAEEDARYVLEVLSEYQRQIPMIFGIATILDNEVRLKVSRPPGRMILHLLDNVQKVLRYRYDHIRKNESFRFYVKLFNEALREKNPDFRLFKIWALLEAMSLKFKGGSKKRIRELFDYYHHAKGAKEYDGHDFIDLANRHRVCIAHFGGCRPGQNSDCDSRYKWCKKATISGRVNFDFLERSASFFLRHFESPPIP
jgi:hypothetical protein